MTLGNLEPADFPESAQIRQGQNIFITGSSGTGKSYIATVISYQACKDGIRTNYASTSKLIV
ncbi:MAG TPA: hypothetical protein DEQ30_11460 [Porphyromonadaceae bacterium]|nr:hypothetical protein [Porphyromonadaceae bacterium]